MTNSKTKVPAKKTSAAAKPKGKPVVAVKAVAPAKPVKAPPQELKKTVPVRKPAPAAPAKLTVVATVPVKKVPAKTTKRKTAEPAVDSKVRIFQIYYQASQRQYLDPAFEPYNNAGDNSPLLEFNVFRKLQNSDLVKGLELWGAVSWRFTEKTGLSGADLQQVIASNPGYDVYYCNPHVELEGLYHNLWLQGETVHPNFMILAEEFYKAVGWPVSHLTAIHSSRMFSSANYFVGTPVFWEKYIQFINKALNNVDKNLSSVAKAMIYSSAADWNNRHAQATYLPFFVERSFSEFLSAAGSTVRVFKYALPAKEHKGNVHLQLLREMKDVAIKTKSKWLATCWVNYRNLYLAQTQNQEWVRKYVRAITPITVDFLDAPTVSAAIFKA